MEKIALSAFDDKRYILNDGVSTLAYGYCDIKNSHKNEIDMIDISNIDVEMDEISNDDNSDVEMIDISNNSSSFLI